MTGGYKKDNSLLTLLSFEVSKNKLTIIRRFDYDLIMKTSVLVDCKINKKCKFVVNAQNFFKTLNLIKDKDFLITVKDDSVQIGSFFKLETFDIDESLYTLP